MGTVKRATVKQSFRPEREAVEPGGGAEFQPRELGDAELAQMENEVSVDRQLREWVERENPERMDVRTYIYRYDNPTTGDLKVLVDRLDGDIPDPHEIGMAYGGGRYCLMVSIPEGVQQKRNVKGLRFRLHPRYDDLRKGAASAAPAGAPAVVSAGSSLRDGIEMVRVVVDMLSPLLQQKQAATPDVSKLLEGQMQMGQTLIQRSLENSAHLVGELQKARLENSTEGDDVDEPDFLTRVMPLVEQFLPVLLGGGQGARQTAAVVRAIPQVQKVIGNRDELARVVAWMDKTYGQKRADQVLEVLKVRRPKVNGKAASVARPRMQLAAAGAGHD